MSEQLTIPPGGAITVRDTLRPGDWGALISLHGSVYCTEFGFAPGFEPYVARTVAEFALDPEARGKVWLAETGDELVGCAAVVHRHAPGGAYGQIRWVLLHPSVRGRGLGKRLLDDALDYCRAQRFAKVYLETTDGLDASLALYRKAGFEIIEDTPMDLWGERRRLIKMALALGEE